jgi:uncharacterized OB-fold protein
MPEALTGNSPVGCLGYFRLIARRSSKPPSNGNGNPFAGSDARREVSSARNVDGPCPACPKAIALTEAGEGLRGSSSFFIDDYLNGAKHDFRLQRCTSCKLFRYPPTTACPWCAELDSEWVSVEGRDTVHSYTEVHHAIQPAFKQYTPYLVLLVELDTQSGKPTKKEGLRVIGNLTRPDGVLAPKSEVERVGIGTRVRMVFTDVAPGLALPQWTIDESAAAARRGDTGGRGA